MKRAVALALLAMAYPLLGCRQILDVDDFGTKPVVDAGVKPTYTGSTDGYSYASEPCRDCVDQECQESAADCAADPGCKAQARCLAQCRATDHDCRGRCSVSTPSTTTIAELIACQAAHCGNSLPAADRCAGSLALHGNAKCDKCLAETCLPALEALSSNPGALAYERRREVCTCRGDCAEGAPGCQYGADEEAMRQIHAVATCCPSDCDQTIPDWSCAGRVESPAPPIPAPPLELHLRGTSPNFSTEVPDLQVQACSDLTEDCELAKPVVTNADGWATLSIPRPTRGNSYFGHLLVTSGEQDDAPALFYFFPPIRESPTWVVRRMVSRSVADKVLEQVPDVEADWKHKGGIVFSARSCNAAPQGLELISRKQPIPDAPPLRVIYFGEGLTVDMNATETTSSGIGFIANAPRGRHELEARHDGQLVGRYSVSVVEGSLTHLVVEPTEL
jgi:hypothetical protein